jgi:hypothetical protein
MGSPHGCMVPHQRALGERNYSYAGVGNADGGAACPEVSGTWLRTRCVVDIVGILAAWRRRLSGSVGVIGFFPVGRC